MENTVRGLSAAAKTGPTNLMAAYRALVKRFGDDVNGATDYVWKAYKGITTKQAAEEDWLPPGTDLTTIPRGPESFDFKFEGTHAHTPSTMEDIKDAADTVAKALVPVSELRNIYSKHIANFHSLDKAGRESLLIKAMPGLRADLSTVLSFQAGSVGHAFPDLKNTMLSKASEITEPEQAFQVLLEYAFKKVFVNEYLAFKKKILSDTARRASVGRPLSVVQTYFEDMRSQSEARGCL